jgi:CheY-like chemotaxis protein
LFATATVTTTTTTVTVVIVGFGYKKENIIVAKNGLQCIKYFNKFKTGYPFIVLIDLKMPIVDGHLTITKLREIFPDPKLSPNMATVSASILATDKTKCTENGVNTFISKPIDKTILENTINKFLE